MNLKAQESPFLKFMFAENVINSVQPFDWCMSHGHHLHPDTISVAK